MSWDQIFFSPFITVPVLCYQPSCRNYCRLSVIFWLTDAKILIQRCNRR